MSCSQALPLFPGRGQLLGTPGNTETKARWDLSNLLTPHTWEWRSPNREDNLLTVCMLTWGIYMWTPLTLLWIVSTGHKTKQNPLLCNNLQSYTRILLSAQHPQTPSAWGNPNIGRAFWPVPWNSLDQSDVLARVFESEGSDRFPRTVSKYAWRYHQPQKSACPLAAMPQWHSKRTVPGVWFWLRSWLHSLPHTPLRFFFFFPFSSWANDLPIFPINFSD